MATNLLKPGQPDPKMDPNFRSGSFPALVTFGFKGIDPPAALYIQRDDVLLLQAASSIVGEVVKFNGRLLLAPLPRGGQPDVSAVGPLPLDLLSSNVVEVIEESITLTNQRVPVSVQRALSEGYLLSLAAIASPGGATGRGQTFARAAIVRSGTQFASIRQVLLSDYVIANHPAGWPGGRVLAPEEGPGFRISRQQANPAAGADWVFTCQANQRFNLVSLSAVLTASATVANRQVELIVDDSVDILWRTSATANVTAGQVVTFSACPVNTSAGVITTDQTLVYPPGLILAPTWRIRTLTTGIQAGDQWSAIFLNLEEQLVSV